MLFGLDSFIYFLSLFNLLFRKIGSETSFVENPIYSSTCWLTTQARVCSDVTDVSYCRYPEYKNL